MRKQRDCLIYKLIFPLTLVILSITGAPNALIASASRTHQTTSISLPIPNFRPNGGLPHWRAARNAIKNGTATRDYLVLFIGESQQAGIGCVFNGSVTGNNVSSDEHSCAGSNLVANILRLNGINAQTNSVFGNQLMSAYNLFDWRVTVGGWFGCAEAGCSYTFGGQLYLNGDKRPYTFKPTDNKAYPYTPKITTDTLDVWSTNWGSDSLEVKSDSGVSNCVIPSAQTRKQLLKTTCSFPAGDNTYSLTCSNPRSCLLMGIIARNSLRHEIAILNGAFPGATVAKWNTNTGLAMCNTQAPCPWDPLPAIKALEPIFCIIQDVENDAGRRISLEKYKMNLSNIVLACRHSGDVLLLNGEPELEGGNPDETGPWQEAVVAVANSLNVPVWDIYKTLGGSNWPMTFYNSAGTQCCGNAWDQEHFSVGIYMWQAVYVSQILMK